MRTPPKRLPSGPRSFDRLLDRVLGLLLDYVMRRLALLIMPWHKGQ